MNSEPNFLSCLAGLVLVTLLIVVILSPFIIAGYHLFLYLCTPVKCCKKCSRYYDGKCFNLDIKTKPFSLCDKFESENERLEKIKLKEKMMEDMKKNGSNYRNQKPNWRFWK